MARGTGPRRCGRQFGTRTCSRRSKATWRRRHGQSRSSPARLRGSTCSAPHRHRITAATGAPPPSNKQASRGHVPGRTAATGAARTLRWRAWRSSPRQRRPASGAAAPARARPPRATARPRQTRFPPSRARAPAIRAHTQRMIRQQQNPGRVVYAQGAESPRHDGQMAKRVAAIARAVAPRQRRSEPSRRPPTRRRQLAWPGGGRR